MLACEGSVTTVWAWAKVNRTPRAARPSTFGVRAGPPSQPRASARSVSIVTSRTFWSPDWPKDAWLGLPEQAAAASAAGRRHMRRTRVEYRIFQNVELRVSGLWHACEFVLDLTVRVP